MRTAVIVLSVALWAPAHAQVPAALPALLGETIAPGQWREYRNVGGGRLYDGRRMKVAYFETERFESRAYQWVEYSSVGESAGAVTRSLVSLDDPARPPLRSLVRLSERLPPGRLPSCDLSEDRAAQYRVIGRQVVDVPAGSFSTTVFEYSSLGVIHRAYVSTADPKGVVLIETPNLRTELIAAGSGARSGLGGGVTYVEPPECPRHQAEGKRAAVIECLEQHVIAAAALGGQTDYEAIWQRATRLCGVNASAGMLQSVKGALQRSFDTQRAQAQ